MITKDSFRQKNQLPKFVLMSVLLTFVCYSCFIFSYSTNQKERPSFPDLNDSDFTSKTIMKGVKSQLECPGCKLLFEDPRVLPCTHTFCRHCLERATVIPNKGMETVSGKDLQYIVCPDCSVQTELPGGDYTQLQYNFSVQHIMDLMSYYTSPDPVPLVFCGMCRKDGVQILPPAIARCSSCAMFLCKQCYELHSMDDFTKLHTTLSITERSDSGLFSYLIPDETTIKNCKKHSWRPYVFFCITCSRGICDSCTNQDHKMHLYARAEDLQSDYSSYIHEILSRTACLQRRTENDIRTTQEMMSRTQLLAATQIEEVLRTHDILTSALDGRLGFLLQEVEKLALPNTQCSEADGK